MIKQQQTLPHSDSAAPHGIVHPDARPLRFGALRIVVSAAGVVLIVVGLAGRFWTVWPGVVAVLVACAVRSGGDGRGGG